MKVRKDSGSIDPVLDIGFGGTPVYTLDVPILSCVGC